MAREAAACRSWSAGLVFHLALGVDDVIGEAHRVGLVRERGVLLLPKAAPKDLAHELVLADGPCAAQPPAAIRPGIEGFEGCVWNPLEGCGQLLMRLKHEGRAQTAGRVHPKRAAAVNIFVAQSCGCPAPCEAGNPLGSTPVERTFHRLVRLVAWADGTREERGVGKATEQAGLFEVPHCRLDMRWTERGGMEALADPEAARFVGGGGDEHGDAEAVANCGDQGGENRAVTLPPTGLGRREDWEFDCGVLRVQLDNRSSDNLAIVTAENDALGLAVVPAEADHR